MIKPFTLKWWLYWQTYCWEEACEYMYKCEQIESHKWMSKAIWINERIINKYGET